MSGALGWRIERIKQTSFPEALETLDPSVELPRRLPGMMSCPMPDHDDKSPSCRITQERFRCFGCGQRGDILDVIRATFDISIHEAVQRAEAILGLEDEGGSLQALVTEAEMAERKRAKKRAEPASAWEKDLDRILLSFLDRVQPFLRTPDWLVRGLVEGPIDGAREAVTDLRLMVPRTSRLRRARLRNLHRTLSATAEMLERSVKAVTGKDYHSCRAES